MRDVIIVGSGISGCALAWQWLMAGKTVFMISNVAATSSSVAAGVYNPTVLKRFTPIWNAQEQLDIMIPFYKAVEQELDFNFMHETPILRRLHDAGEAKTWERKALRDDLKDFMSPYVLNKNVDGIHANAGYGIVNPSGWCDTVAYMFHTINYLKAQDAFVQETLDHTMLQLHENHVSYKELNANRIIFAEGMSLLNNPFYNHLPLQGNKGELLIVRIPNFKLEAIIKSSVFLMHYKDDLFWVGATYDRDDLELIATQNARNYLISRLETFLTVPYEIVNHKVGLRPTTTDRRPFIGTSDGYKRHYVFNGMGSRAVLLAPWAAQQLYKYMYNGQALNREVDISRFNAS